MHCELSLPKVRQPARKFDGFCLVTSDSDFTGLAVRIREEGLTVFGFGEKKTPAAFRNACHKFLETELLRTTVVLHEDVEISKIQEEKNTIAEPVESGGLVKQVPKDFLLRALEQSPTDDAGWAHLGTFGSYLTKLQPDFDSRKYGYKKLTELIKALAEIFETDERQAPGSNQKNLYLRAK